MAVVRLPRGFRLPPRNRKRSSPGAGRTPVRLPVGFFRGGFRLPSRSGAKRPTRTPGGFRSKLEERFAGELELRRRAGELCWWAYEPVRLKLGEGATYCPDFGTVDADGRFELWETKGFRREASIVRLKVAASLYWWWRFKLVTADGPRAFRVEDVRGGPRPNCR